MKLDRRLSIAACVGVLAVAACGDDAATSSPNANASDAGGPTQEGTTGKPPGAVPALDLAGGPADASPPTIPTFDLDAGPAATLPDEPIKRKIWAIDARRHLLRFLVEDPSKVADVTLVRLPAGAEQDQIIGIDFRPSTKQLYALTNKSRLYIINRATAEATQVGTAPIVPAVSGQAFGFDFNPMADKIRVHSDVDQNLRVDPTTGTIVGNDADAGVWSGRHELSAEPEPGRNGVHEQR